MIYINSNFKSSIYVNESELLYSTLCDIGKCATLIYNKANDLVTKTYNDTGVVLRYPDINNYFLSSTDSDIKYTYSLVNTRFAQQIFHQVGREWKDIFKATDNCQVVLSLPANRIDSQPSDFYLNSQQFTIKNRKICIDLYIRHNDFQDKYSMQFTCPVGRKPIKAVYFIKTANGYRVDLIHKSNPASYYTSSQAYVTNTSKHYYLCVSEHHNNLATLVSNNESIEPVVISNQLLLLENSALISNFKKLNTDFNNRYTEFNSKKLDKLLDNRYSNIKRHALHAAQYIIDLALSYNTTIVIDRHKPTNADDLSLNSDSSFKPQQYHNYLHSEYCKTVAINMLVNYVTELAESNDVAALFSDNDNAKFTSFIDGESPFAVDSYFTQLVNHRDYIANGLFKTKHNILVDFSVNAAYQSIRSIDSNAFSDNILLYQVTPTIHIL